MKAKLFILFVSFFYCTFVFSQADRSNVKKGNKQYDKEHYTEAEISYREALQHNNRSVEANFNLGNALYRQGKFANARDQFQVAATSENPLIAAGAYHNIGNSFMEEQNYAQSVEAYKRALRLNPKDNETRYNLAVANALLKQQQQNQDQQGGGGDNDQDNKDDQQDSQQQQQQANEEQQQQDNMSRENAQQILDAFAEDEKELLEKMNKKQDNQSKRQPDKDW